MVEETQTGEDIELDAAKVRSGGKIVTRLDSGKPIYEYHDKYYSMEGDEITVVTGPIGAPLTEIYWIVPRIADTYVHEARHLFEIGVLLYRGNQRCVLELLAPITN